MGVGEFWRRRRVSRYSLSPPGMVFGGLFFMGDWGRVLLVGVMVTSAYVELVWLGREFLSKRAMVVRFSIHATKSWNVGASALPDRVVR